MIFCTFHYKMQDKKIVEKQKAIIKLHTEENEELKKLIVRLHEEKQQSEKFKKEVAQKLNISKEYS